MNPTNPEVYDILEKMYSEFYEMFEYDTFHIGGDEVRTFELNTIKCALLTSLLLQVKFECWNTSSTVRQRIEDKQWKTPEQGTNNDKCYFQLLET